MITEEIVRQGEGQTRTQRQYEIGPQIEVGGLEGYANYFQIRDIESSEVMAVKIIPKNTLIKNSVKERLAEEVKIHKNLLHEHIIKLDHVFENQENIYLICQYFSNKTLSQLLKTHKSFNENDAKHFIKQITQALKYLRDNKIIHRDLKLSNILVGNNNNAIKLCDFGFATKLEYEGERINTICGTSNLIAPEILDNKIGYSYEVDIWYLGVIFYTLLCGEPPFQATDIKKTYSLIKADNFTFLDKLVISDSAKNLITLMLQLDPTKRPNLDQILGHSFFNN